jgi:hypothetical protein
VQNRQPWEDIPVDSTFLSNFERELNSRPLKSIDLVLAELAKHSSNSNLRLGLLALMAKAILKAEQVPETQWGDNAIKGLFDQNLSQQNQRFTAICLLRLLSVADDCFDDGTLRVHAFDLFDARLEDLYKSLKIDPRDQTFEKRSTLKGVTLQVEQEMAQLLGSLTELHQVPGFRQELMKKLNCPLGKSILGPFLPAQLLAIRLNGVFTALQEYQAEPGLRKVEAFTTAQNLLKEYAEEAEHHGTQYSREILGNLTQKLKAIIESDFHGSPLSNPASVQVRRSLKKYPFSADGNPVLLQLVIDNQGPGPAFETCVTLEEATDLQLDRRENYLGELARGSLTVDFPATVQKPTTTVVIVGEVSWTNFDQSKQTNPFELELDGQVSEIDWDALSSDDPYSTEPVARAEDLVGRTEVMNKLLATTKPNRMGSSYVFGQKRVGKTSVVKALRSQLRRMIPDDNL